METIYKGLIIRHRPKPWITSAYDYDWCYIIDGIPFWKYAPSLADAKDEIDQFFVDQSFLEIDTDNV